MENIKEIMSALVKEGFVKEMCNNLIKNGCSEEEVFAFLFQSAYEIAQTK